MRLLMASFTTQFDADHRQLSDARQQLRAWLHGGDRADALSDDRRLDIDVVVTELAANAIDHTEADDVEVVVRVGTTWATIEVTNTGPCDLVPPVERWGDLTQGDRGRGLRIVRALADDIDIMGDGHATTIRCRVRIS